MSNYEDLIRAASKAQAAGDTAAVRKILAVAQQVRTPRSAVGDMPRAEMGVLDGRTGPAPDRFGDTIEKATRGPRRATAQSFSETMDPQRTGLQRAGSAAMTGLNALGTGVAFGAGLVGETLGGSPTNEVKLAQDLMMMGQVAVPELAGVSGATIASGRAASAASRPIPNPASAIERGKRAADDLGVTPSLGAGGKVRGMTAAGLEKVPLAGGVIGKDASRFVDEIETAASRVKLKVGNASVPSEAGDTLQSGLGRYIERAKATAEKKFSEVAKHLPPETDVPLTNTVKAIEDVKEHFANLPALSNKLGLNQWDDVLAEAQQNGINWQAVRQLRSQVGEAIGSNRGTLVDEDVGRLKRLYQSLTNDMDAVATASGPDAKAAWKSANDYYRNFNQRVELALDKTIKANSPERAFEAFANMTRADSASSDVIRMRKIKSSLKPQEWKDISASLVDRMGKPTAGQRDALGDGFSPARFLTQWNNMSTEAKRLLLPEDVRVEFEKVASLADMAKAANVERNFPNTGTPFGMLATLFGTSTVPVATAVSIGSATVGAKALTSKVFLRALNRAGRGDIKQIKAMAGGKGPFTQDAKTVLQIMGAETAAAGGANQNARPLQQAQ